MDVKLQKLLNKKGEGADSSDTVTNYLSAYKEAEQARGIVEEAQPAQAVQTQPANEELEMAGAAKRGLAAKLEKGVHATLRNSQLTPIPDSVMTPDKWEAMIDPLSRKEWEEIIGKAKDSIEKILDIGPEFTFSVKSAIGALDTSLRRLCAKDEQGCSGALALAENSLVHMRRKVYREIDNCTTDNEDAQFELSAMLRCVSCFQMALSHMQDYLESNEPTDLFYAWEFLGDGVMNIIASERLQNSSRAA